MASPACLLLPIVAPLPASTVPSRFSCRGCKNPYNRMSLGILMNETKKYRVTPKSANLLAAPPLDWSVPPPLFVTALRIPPIWSERLGNVGDRDSADGLLRV